MKNGILLAVTITILILSQCPFTYSQTIEYKDGVKYIHNDKPKWGNEPKVKLEFVQTIGGIDEEDENYIMYEIFDVDMDKNGKKYILDKGNHRIQVFDPEGQFSKTIGRKGEGPGEFISPMAVDIDNNIIVIGEAGSNKILILDLNGRETKRINVKMAEYVRSIKKEKFLIGRRNYSLGMAKNPDMLKKMDNSLVYLCDRNGKIQYGFGNPIIEFFQASNFYLEDERVNFEIDRYTDVFFAYYCENKIEKYSFTGKLIFQAKRKMTYDENKWELKDDNLIKPRVFATGIGIDNLERVWVLSIIKQPDKWERLNPVRTDFAEFEIFDSEGILLGKIPLPEDTFRFRIIGDRLFIIDYDRVSVSEYRIVDNSQ